MLQTIIWHADTSGGAQCHSLFTHIRGEVLGQWLHLRCWTNFWYPCIRNEPCLGPLRVRSDPRLLTLSLTPKNPHRYAQQPGAIPFAQASYTLRVYDERGIDAVATPGYFNGANSIVYFALYSPAAYTPLASGAPIVRAIVCMLFDH